MRQITGSSFASDLKHFCKECKESIVSNIYSSLGVSATKDEVKSAIKEQDQGLFPGAFCNIRADFLAKDPSYCVAIHADGAGTKSIFAYLYYKETGSTERFRGIAQDSTVMNIDDLACVGAVDGFLLSNTIGRNAHRIGGDVLKALIDGYLDFANKMRAVGVSIDLGGGETADIGDLVATVVVDSTVFVRLRRAEVVDVTGAKPGHVIVGLSSTGQASYEDAPNSGIGSNGISGARHMLLAKAYAEKYPEAFSSTIDPKLVFRGRYRLDDTLPHSSFTVGDALLSPTRTYVPIIKKVLAANAAQVSGIVHCSGGGQVKCRNFGRGLRYVKNNLFDMPPIFRAIYDNGGVSMKEMYQTFNMGHRMEIYCDPTAARAVIDAAASFGVEAKVVGHIEPGKESGNEVILSSPDGTLQYA
jgi:phosphoribosylformylglycinamidine cyclo-ligase